MKFFLILVESRVKPQFGCSQFHNSEEVEVVVRECLTS